MQENEAESDKKRKKTWFNGTGREVHSDTET